MGHIKTKTIQNLFLLLIQVMIYSTCCLSMKLEFIDDFRLPQDNVKIQRRIQTLDESDSNKKYAKMPMPGKIIEIFIALGQVVQEGDLLFTVEGMKMKSAIRSHVKGKILSIPHKLQSTVGFDFILASILPSPLDEEPLPPHLKTPNTSFVAQTITPSNDFISPSAPSFEETDVIEVISKNEKIAVLQEAFQLSFLRRQLIPIFLFFPSDEIISKGDVMSALPSPLFFKKVSHFSGPPTNFFPGNKIEKANNIYKEHMISAQFSPANEFWSKGLLSFSKNKIINHYFSKDINLNSEIFSLKKSKWIGGVGILIIFILSYITRNYYFAHIRKKLLQKQSSFLPIITYLHAADFNKHPFLTEKIAYNINLPPQYMLKAA